MSLPILATKLYPPMPRPNLVPRARLMSRLVDGLTRKLTLVSAPAGFGKTTLLSEWRAEGEHARSLAWLTLDEADNDAVRFWSHAIAALETIDVFMDAEAKALLQAASPQIEAVLSVLVNALASQPADRVLVLDDYQLVRSEAVNGSLAFFLEHIPPTLHLVILSRADPQLPLARLRVRDQLVELRASDLRCTRDETAAFFTRAVGLALTDRAVAALDTRTEGWLAGLQLVALSVKDRTADQAEQFIAGLTGTHHHILDYLVEEVLQRQPEDVRNFLLKTSILQQLNVSLCEAVTGHNQAHAMLTQVEHANLFLEPLDAVGEWYRYHRLFGEVLQAQLQLAQPEIMTQLHRRAYEWYAHQGLTHEAMHHALAAQQYEWAAALLEREYRDMVFRGELAALRAWLDALPSDLVRARPRLALAHAWASAYVGRYDVIEQYLAQADQAVPQMPSAVQTALHGEVLALRAVIQSVAGDARQAIDNAHTALSYVPQADRFLLMIVHHAIGNSQRRIGRPLEAEPALQTARELGQSLNGIILNTAVHIRLGQVQIMRGQLRQAMQTFEATLQLGGGDGLPNTCEAYIRRGDVYREWNDLDAALENTLKGTELAQRVGNATALLSGYFTLMHVQIARGEMFAAREALRQAEQYAARYDFPGTAERVGVHRAWLDSVSDQLAAAHAWADGYLANRALTRSQAGVPTDLHDTLLARIFIQRGRAPEAQRVLEDLRGEAEETGRGWTLIQTLSLQALALEAQHRHDQALNTLRQALTLAEPEGYIRLFADEGEGMRLLLDDLQPSIQRQPDQRLDTYLSSLLAAFPASAAVPHVEHSKPRSQALIEPLTARELEILRLLASGASNQQIADRLVIGIGTVKAHLNHIFGKLNAHNRVEAIAKAQKLGLIDQM